MEPGTEGGEGEESWMRRKATFRAVFLCLALAGLAGAAGGASLELVAESERRVRNMSRQQWQALQQEGQEVHLALAALMDRPADDPQVQALIARHYAMMNQFYPVSAEIYRGLGQLYITNDEFRAFYEKIRPGLAEFLQPAMAYYAEHALEKK